MAFATTKRTLFRLNLFLIFPLRPSATSAVNDPDYG